MQKLIKDGAIVDSAWQSADAESAPGDNQIRTLEQWQAQGGAAVQLEPGDSRPLEL